MNMCDMTRLYVCHISMMCVTQYLSWEQKMQEDENQLQGVEAGKQQISQRLAQLKVCACGGGCVCVCVCVCGGVWV